VIGRVFQIFNQLDKSEAAAPFTGDIAIKIFVNASLFKEAISPA
jgi:hypothetical protein